MKKHFGRFALLVGTLFCLLFSPACAAPLTRDVLREINATAPIHDVCARASPVHQNAAFWARDQNTGQNVSDANPEALKEFVRDRAVDIFAFDPDAPPESVTSIPQAERVDCPKREGYLSIEQAKKKDECADVQSATLAIPDDAYRELTQAMAQACTVAENSRPDPRYVGQDFRGGGIRLGPISRALDKLLKQSIEESFRTGKPVPIVTEEEKEPRAVDHPVVQFSGGVTAGISVSMVPLGSAGADVAIQSGALPQGSRWACIGKGIGEMAAGAAQLYFGCKGMIAGGAMTTTGPGAIVGVPLVSGSLAVASNGAITLSLGVQHTFEALLRSEDGVTAPAPASTPAPASAPAAPPAKPAQASQPAASPVQPSQPAATPPPGGPGTAAKPVGKVTTNPTGTVTTRTWVKCTGDKHHAISAKIHKALENHQILKGHYRNRDDRLVTQALNKKAHDGYQMWHRDMEREVIRWIEKENKATPAQFEEYLRNLYATHPDLSWRFPNGL